jgi:hypothetical protein
MPEPYETWLNQQEPLALYVENVTPAEVAELFRRLCIADNKHGTDLFQQVVTSEVSAEDLAGVLGGPAREYAPPSQRPVEHGTAGQIINSLPGEPGSTTAERVLIVVPHNPPQSAPYDQVRHLLDSYREHRPGTIQLLLVLWGNS